MNNYKDAWKKFKKNLREEIQDIRKNQMEVLDLRIAITEI